MRSRRLSLPRRGLIALAAVIVLLVASACDDDETNSPPTLPAETVTASATETPATSEELFYVRADQSGWIYDTGTGEQRQIVESGVCERWAQTALWNHDGSLMALTCGTSAASDIFVTHVLDASGAERERLSNYRALGWSPAANQLLLIEDVSDGEGPRHDQVAIYDADGSGTEALTPIEDATTGVFSPDGASLAYYRPPDAACAPGCETGLIIRKLEDGSERQFDDVVPAVWISEDHAMIVRPPGASAAAGGALIMSPSSGAITPFPSKGDFGGYWVSPDRTRVIFLSNEEGLGLAVLDLASMQVTQIDGSRIGYPSDHIPEQHVALTDDTIYWFDATGEMSPWYSARYDGSGLKQLGEAPSLFMVFSARREFVAYPTAVPSGAESQVVVARIDGGEPVELGTSGFVMAWRPVGD